MEPRVYLPVEIKAREWQARILLAGVCAEKGFEVVLGEQKEILGEYQDGEPGVWLFKGAGKRSVDRFRRLRDGGHRVTSLCEEGLVFLDRRTYQARKVHPETLSHVDRFFAWGREQAETILEKIPELEERLSIVGNPRVDLLRPELRDLIESEQGGITKRFGRFVLINTNFARANHFHGCEWQLELMVKRGMLGHKDDERTFWEQVEFQNTLMREFAALALELSRRYPDINVVVRPHPSENSNTWNELIGGAENIHVVYEDSVLPWLSAAELVVHNGCTTAVEAYLMGKMPIAYRPVHDDRFEPRITNAVSLEAVTRDDVLDLYGKLRRGETAGNTGSIDGTLEHYLAATEGRLSSDRIADAFLDLPCGAAVRTPESRPSMNVGRYFAGIRGRLFPAKETRIGDPAAYQDQKFPGVANGEVQGYLRIMGDSLSRFDGVRIEKMPGTRNCFQLRRPEPPGLS